MAMKYKHLIIMDGSGLIEDYDLSRTEAQLNCKFPEDFRRYQKAFNGGKPVPSFFVYAFAGEQEVSWIDQINPISDSLIDSLNMIGASRKLVQMRDMGMPTPDDTIAIGICGGNDTLLLSVRGDRCGSVLVKQWEHAEPTGESRGDPEDGVVLLAKSFDAFLEKLCTEEDADRMAS